MKKYSIIILAMLFSLMAGASDKKVNLSSPDVNGDGVVNAQDLVMLINYYLEQKDSPKTKIVVLSDPHVMAPELLVSNGYAEMVIRLKDDIKPDLVLITGDLTKDGERLSHEYVKGKLDELRASGIRTLVIPGNHDRGGSIDAVVYDNILTYPAEVATDEWFATQYADYGYSESSEREATTLTYACEPVSNLVVIGIDSGIEGTLSAQTLSWVVDKAKAATASGKRVIAMMHHPLIPHVTNAESLVPTYVVSNHDYIRNALIDAGIKVIFTGHFHTSDIAKDYNDEITKEIFDVNTGSLISYPCDYREVTISDDLMQLSLTTGHITSLTGDDNFSSDLSKARLHSSVKKMVKEKMEAKAGIAAKLMAATIESMATLVADAFIVHAEGNEADVDTEAIMKGLSPAFIMMSGTEDMCRSMLKDKAPYGIEGRENVTNDLILSIIIDRTDIDEIVNRILEGK